MKIEATLKCFSPKSLIIDRISKSTSKDGITSTDLIAALGLTESRAAFGLAIFLGKNNISEFDKKRAVKFLAQYAIRTAPKLVGKASGQRMVNCMLILSKAAFDEYCRSAASSVTCHTCKGRGVLSYIDDVVKHPGCGKTPAIVKKEPIEIICPTCKGKRIISKRCRCNGTGKTLHTEYTKFFGRPIYTPCKRCDGAGFRSEPSSIAYAAVKAYLPTLHERTWRRNWKPFLESLVIRLRIEEEYAAEEFEIAIDDEISILC